MNFFYNPHDRKTGTTNLLESEGVRGSVFNDRHKKDLAGTLYKETVSSGQVFRRGSPLELIYSPARMSCKPHFVG